MENVENEKRRGSYGRLSWGATHWRTMGVTTVGFGRQESNRSKFGINSNGDHWRGDDRSRYVAADVRRHFWAMDGGVSRRHARSWMWVLGARNRARASRLVVGFG